MLPLVAFAAQEAAIFVLLSIIGFGLGYFVRVWQRDKSIKTSREMAQKIVEDGKKEVEKAKRESVLEAKQDIFALRKDFDRDMRDRRQVVITLENKISQREDL